MAGDAVAATASPSFGGLGAPCRGRQASISRVEFRVTRPERNDLVRSFKDPT